MHNPYEHFYMNIELTSEDARMPTRAIHDDAGLDVYSPIETSIPPRGDVKIPLDFKVEFPKGFMMVFKEKSGKATQLKTDVGACVIDAGYRGIVHAHLFNNSDVEVKILKGDKLAQFVVTTCWHGTPTQVDSINTDTARGSGGFGHTGR